MACTCTCDKGIGKALRGNRPCGVAVRRQVVDPVPKRAIYSIMYIYGFFSTLEVTNMLVNFVILQ